MGRLALIGGILLLGFSAGADDKKPTAKPAPKPAAKAPANKGTASSGANKGPTTSGANKGPTTSTAGHGPTTAGAGHTTTGPAAGHSTTMSTSGPAHNAPGGGAGARAPVQQAHGPISRPEPRGSRTISTPGGNAVRMRANGSRSDVHVAARGNARAMDIHHGLGGGRRVEVERRDGSRVVVERGGRGYVQRPYRYGGREYAHRTYYRNGRVYDRYYAPYSYRGGFVSVYSPVAYFAPAYYGWAYNPWAAPVPYAWGWGGNPWYGYYGAYFTPYPVYPSASLWLTDYLISQTLMTAYQERAAAAAQAGAPGDAAPLTPQVKGLIAAEVQRQIALENTEAKNAQADPASSGINRLMSDNVQHVFVAGRDLDVTDAGGAECALSQGDAIQLTGPPAADATAATLIVLSSKGGQECPKGDLVSVAFADLQEMQNHLRETIDQGMGDLQAKQGHGGLPALPPSAQGEPVKTAFAANAPPPEQDVATQLNEQAQEADKAENEVAAEAAKSGGAPAEGAAQTPPAQISMGQTIDEVTAILGKPKNIVDLGTKKIYVYNDMKITFKAGKVADVE
jgi:hypothetical protein